MYVYTGEREKGWGGGEGGIDTEVVAHKCPVYPGHSPPLYQVGHLSLVK